MMLMIQACIVMAFEHTRPWIDDRQLRSDGVVQSTDLLSRCLLSCGYI